MKNLSLLIQDSGIEWTLTEDEINIDLFTMLEGFYTLSGLQ